MCWRKVRGDRPRLKGNSSKRTVLEELKEELLKRRTGRGGGGGVLLRGAAPYLRKSSRVLAELGIPRSIQDRKWNWVTVRVSLVCRFFR